MASKPEKMQENQTPYPIFFFFFSSNITKSIIVVTNMATFQCNYSLGYLYSGEAYNLRKLNFATENYCRVRLRSHWASSPALT